MIYPADKIFELIPHRAPFIMVGDLLAVSDEQIVTNFHVADNVMCEDGYFSFPGLIENIAQTCAVGLGYLTIMRGETINPGFIGGINKLTTHARPSVNDTIITKVDLLQQLDNVFLIQGANYLGDELLVKCQMKIVEVKP